MVIRLLLWAICLCLPLQSAAQTLAVDPDDLTLTITVEELSATPMRQEMILLTIHGVYQRHITLEKLEQPDLAGFNWMQLGQDHWFESMLDGRPVKNMRRRMALFPDATGRLEIGSFRHHLTLLDENNKWFEHTVRSEPVAITVDPAPAGPDWWFPVRRLTVSDNWSNAPDQLVEGAGVLRIIRVSALGASPDMIPPMPTLNSPSALIFAHPEQRLVDLTSRGPEAIAFWRWTITPTNGHAAILEPISFSYFDTVARRMRRVDISAQRVAFGDVTGTAPLAQSGTPDETALRPGLLVAAGLLGLLGGMAVVLRGHALSLSPLRGWWQRQWLVWQFTQSVRRRDAASVRRNAHALDQLYPVSGARQALLSAFDSVLFGRSADAWNPSNFGAEFRRALTKPVVISTGTKPSR